MEIEQMRIRMGEMAAEIDRLQSIIDGQQSPAVAVPDGCTLISNENLENFGNREFAKGVRSVIASTRITEQDALPVGFREEWKRNVMLMWSCVRKHDSSIPSDVLDYMREKLLTKLNEANHAAYDPIQLLETARTALADIANAKDLTLEAAQRKAKRIYREIRQAMDGE